MREGVDLAHGLDPETARAALVSERAVDEPVAIDPFAGFERRANRLRDMIRARGGEQQGLGLRSPAILIAARAAAHGCFCAFAPAGFACHEHVDPALLSASASARTCGGLADPLPAFERDERAALRSRHSEQRLEAEPDAAEEAGAADVLAGDERHDLRRRVGGGDRRDRRRAGPWRSARRSAPGSGSSYWSRRSRGPRVP